MKPYKPSEIIIPADRQRREFDSDILAKLLMDINGKRLMQAPVVRETDKGPQLVAGETRIKVINDIFALGGHFYYDGVKYTDMIPTVTLGELTPIEAMEAELHENILRADLTWQEHAAAVKKLHELRVAQAEAKYPGVIDPEGGLYVAPKAHTVSDTAREVTGRADGGFREAVRRELILAEHMDKPEVHKAKTPDEAWKNLKKLETNQENVALAAEVGKTFSASLHDLVQANCLKWMARYIADGRPKFKVILTDPPYGMGADEFGDAAGKMRAGIDHEYNDSPEAWRELMTDWCPLSYAITEDQAHAYVFCDIDRFHELRGMMQAAGWTVHRTPIIDYKLEGGRVPWPDYGPRRSWELVLYAVKGKMPVTHIYPDVIPCRADEQLLHGAQKPVSLYHNLLLRSVRPGYRVLDTFCGTGPIFPSAHQHKCIATGVEMSPESYGKAVTRIRELQAVEGDIRAFL